jgi:hypothetical protein
MSGPLGETVVLHSRGKTGEDADGNDVYGDTNTTINGVTLDPWPSVEFVQGQDLNVIGLRAVFIPGVELSATDEITARGARWAIDGEPAQYHSSLTGKTLTQVHLTRATG